MALANYEAVVRERECRPTDGKVLARGAANEDVVGRLGFVARNGVPVVMSEAVMVVSLAVAPKREWKAVLNLSRLPKNVSGVRRWRLRAVVLPKPGCGKDRIAIDTTNT